MSLVATDEAACVNQTVTALPPVTDVEGQPLNDGGNFTALLYQHNTSTSPTTASPPPRFICSPCPLIDNSSDVTSVSGLAPAYEIAKTGCNSSTAASGVGCTSIGDDKRAAASTSASRKSTESENVTVCCTASALSTRGRVTKRGSASTFSTQQITVQFLSNSTERGPTDTSTQKPPVTVTYLQDYIYTSSGRINNKTRNGSNSLWSAVSSNTQTVSVTSPNDVVTESAVDHRLHNCTFNLMFSGNCAALRRRGPGAEKRFRSVVVDALSSGLAVAADRLVAGELRCGSLNLSMALLEASDDDVRRMMSTLAAATLRVSVDDVDETFVLSRVELASVEVDAAVTRVMSGQAASTRSPGVGSESIAILVVFVIIGALAVLAGTVSAAIYLYFRRIYCRTFVVNRRALRWSSRASDTVQVINVDDDDGSAGGASSRSATNDAVEWLPPISGSGFGDDGLPLGFDNWPPSPHYCQASPFRRLIVPPPPTLASLPELLDDEEATVHITSDATFCPRQQSCVISLLQPVCELHDVSTKDSGGEDTCQCKRDVGLTHGRASLDWNSDKFFNSDNKERATPF